jgi:hypothetical protein
MDTSGFASAMKQRLNHCGQVVLWPEHKLNSTKARLAAWLKKKAFEERDAANDRMCLHKLACPDL